LLLVVVSAGARDVSAVVRDDDAVSAQDDHDVRDDQPQQPSVCLRTRRLILSVGRSIAVLPAPPTLASPERRPQIWRTRTCRSHIATRDVYRVAPKTSPPSTA